MFDEIHLWCYTLPTSWQEALWSIDQVHILPKDITVWQQWVSNPRSSDHEFYALTIRLFYFFLCSLEIQWRVFSFVSERSKVTSKPITLKMPEPILVHPHNSIKSNPKARTRSTSSTSSTGEYHVYDYESHILSTYVVTVINTDHQYFRKWSITDKVNKQCFFRQRRCPKWRF